jgi:hypothetical protein
VESGSLEETSFSVRSPLTLPNGVTLTLQVKREGESEFEDRASGVGEDQLVPLQELESDSWYAIRWIIEESV